MSIPFLRLYLANIDEHSESGNGDGGGGNGIDDKRDEEKIVLASGTYTGLHLYAKNLLIPEGNVVIFKNAQIYGGELNVYGSLTIEDSIIDHTIHGYDNGLINIINLTVQFGGGSIYLHGNSKAIVKNMTNPCCPPYFPYSHCYYYIFDCSNLTISNCMAYICINNKGTINATNLFNLSMITMRSSSKATIKLSNLTSISCFEQPQIYLLQKTIVHYLGCGGTSTSYPYNRAKIYKDGSSEIKSQHIDDEAQVIDI